MSAAARIDELKKRYDENPRRFFAPLANEFRKAGDLDQAIALCQEHLADQPGNMNGHVVYGQALYDAHRYDESHATFEAALTLDPENLIALRHLGDISRANQDYVRAREWYSRVLDADPRNDEILAFIADLDVAEQQARDFAAAPRVSTGTPVIPQTPVAPQAAVAPATPIRSSTPITPMTGSLEMEAVSMDFISSAEPPMAESVEVADLAAFPSFDEIGFSDLGPAVVTPAPEESIFESMEFQPPTLDHAPMEGLIDNPLFDDEPAAETAPIGETAPAFVTETMAELYLTQGFLSEALGVYRQLLEQNPGDERLREKVRALEPIDEPIDEPIAPAAEIAEIAVPMAAAAPAPAALSATNGSSARTFFSRLAARRAVPRATDSVATLATVDSSAATAESTAPSAVESELFGDTQGRTSGAANRVQRGGTLDALFGAEPDENAEHVALKFASIADGVDVVAAVIKGRPTQAASDELSLDSVFRDTPSRASTVVKRQSQLLRFDQFFSPADEIVPDVAPPAPAGEPGSPADLDQFQDWLTQLKKPS